MLNQDICTLYDSIAVYDSYGGIVFAEEEGRNIARALGSKNKVRNLNSAQTAPSPFPFLPRLTINKITHGDHSPSTPSTQANTLPKTRY